MGLGISKSSPIPERCMTQTSPSLRRVKEPNEDELGEPEGCVPSLKVLTEIEVQRMISEERRTILILHSNVYDVTDFVADHPGGEMSIMSKIGRDSGAVFDRIHSKRAKKLVKKFIVGRLESTDTGVGFVPPEEAAPSTFEEATVLDIEEMTECVRKITLSCPERLKVLPGGHIKIVLFDRWGGELPKRCSYVPFVCTENTFAIVVKRYSNRISSDYLCSLKCGDRIRYEHPAAPLWIAENDEQLQNEAFDMRHLIFIAGGVGVVSIYAIVSHVLQTQMASVTLVVSYQDLNHAILRQELAVLMDKYGEKRCENGMMREGMPRKTLKLHFVFTQLKEVVDVPEAYMVHLGRFGPHVLRHLTRATSVVICGSPTFSDDVTRVFVEGGVCDRVCVHTL